MRGPVAYPAGGGVSLGVTHSVAAIAVVVIVYVVAPAQQREVLEVGGATVRPSLQMVDIAVLPGAVALGVGADKLGGREGELLPEGSGAFGAAKFEGKALLIHRTEEIVLRGTQAEEIERRKLDAGAGGEAGIAAHRLQFFQGGGDEERTKAR